MARKVPLGPADLPEGGMRGHDVGEHLVLIARLSDGYRAIDDWCSHAGCLLSGGRLEPAPGGGTMVVCPCHEIGFHLDTGRNSTSPALCEDQRAFRVSVEDGVVYVELPEDD